MKQYDSLVVGAGLFGAVFARQAADAGKKVLVIDKRDHIAGNVYTEQVEGIHVHRYGAHIFHTNNKTVWDYITRFAEFNRLPTRLIACSSRFFGSPLTAAFCRLMISSASFGVAIPHILLKVFILNGIL